VCHSIRVWRRDAGTSSNVYSPRPDRNRATLAHSRSTCQSPWHRKRLSTTTAVGRTTRPSSSSFAAKTELTVLFNCFSLKYKTRSVNESSHDHPEITRKPHAKFGADLKETVARYWKQINTQILFLLYLRCTDPFCPKLSGYVHAVRQCPWSASCRPSPALQTTLCRQPDLNPGCLVAKA